MRGRRAACRGRTWVEVLLALAVSTAVLIVFVPAMSMAVERAWASRCQGHLGELFRAMNLYLHPDRGGNHLPAGEPEGPAWFERLEPLVAGFEEGRACERFACPKAPPGQQGFTRDSLSFGWNEGELPLGTVVSQVMQPRTRVVLGDSLGSGDGARADTLVTSDGQVRLDARHDDRGHLLFLDGHIEPHTRPQVEARWPERTLAPPRPPGETANPVRAMAWWHWALLVVCVAASYGLATGGVHWLEARRAARQEQLLHDQEEAARQEKVKEETARDAERKAHLRRVPCGPVEPVELPGAVLSVDRRKFELRPDREFLLGRAESADVQLLNDRTISRHHAKIRPEPQGYVLYDLASRSGTHVGEERIECHVLADRDTIRLGPTVQLTFVLSDRE